MLKNWFRYLIILLCTTAFYICFSGYYSLYAILACLALPVLSLLLSLPAMLTLRLYLESPEAPQNKGESFSLRLTASHRSPLPCGRAWAAVNGLNQFTGDRCQGRVEFTPSRQPLAVEYQASSDLCGLLCFRLDRVWVCDLLGLVSLPVRLRKGGGFCQTLILPNVHRPVMGLEEEAAPEGDGQRYSLRRPGSDPTELFGLREYQPGDRLNRVDWKLSQKTGAILVREGSLPVSDRVVLLASFDGEAQEADACMDVLATVHHFLAAWEAGHLVCFPSVQGLAALEVQEPEEAPAVVQGVLLMAERGSPAPDFVSLPGGASHILYLCAQPDRAVLGALREKYPEGKLTVLHCRPGEALSPDVESRQVRPSHIAQDLEGVLL